LIALRTAIVAALLATASPLAAKSVCYTPEEVRAAQLRQFHNQLQVAALNCRGDDPSLSGKYATYAQRFGGTLGTNAKVLHAHFARAYGSDANRQFDRFNTAVTNRESLRVHETAGYCETYGPIFDKLAGMTPHQLEAFATETVADPSDVTACPAVQKAETRKAKPAARKTAQAG
jgi:hypothetical protein